MRWTFRLGWAVLAAALVAFCIDGVTVRAGGGVPEEGEKKTGPGTRPKPSRAPARPLPGAARTSRRDVPLAAEVKKLRVAEVVPKDVLFFVTVPDLSELRSAAGELALTKIFQEPAISLRLSAAFEAVRGSARGAIGEGILGFIQMALASNVDYAMAKPVFRKELALVGLPPREEGGQIRLAAVAVVSVNRQPLTDVIEDLKSETIDRYHQTTHAPLEERGETKITGLKVGAFQIAYAYYENLFIVGTGKGTVAQLIDTYAGASEKRLASDGEFRKAREELGKGAALFYRVNLKDVMATSLRSILPEKEGAAPPTSMAGRGTLWGGVYFDGAAIRERMEFRAPAGAKASVLTPGVPLPVPPRSLRYFPVDTVLYTAASLDLAKAIREIKQEAKTDLRAAWLAFMLAQAGAKLGGIDIQGEVLPAFGGELAAGVVIPHGRPPEVLLVAQIKRRDLVDKALSAIAKVVGPENLKEEQYRGGLVRYVEVPKDAGEPSIIKMIMPAVAYTRVRQEGHDFLVVGSSRRALLKAMRQSHFEKSSLAEKEDFKRCLGSLRPRWTSAFYANLPQILDSLRGPIRTGVGGEMPGPFAGSDARAEIARALAQHLFGLGMVSDEREAVSFQESYGPLGPVTGAGMLVAAGLESRVTSEAPQTPEADAANLARIGVALQLYATDFDRFPLSLSELHDEYIGSLDYFNAPGGKREVKARGDVDTKSDYAYVSGLKPTDLSNMILAYTKEHVHGGLGRNVLFLGGRVMFLPEVQFQATLKDQEESLADR